MTKMRLGLLTFGFVLVGLLAGCAKTEEVVPPVSTLETSLLPSGVATQNPWPTAAVSPGQPTPTVSASNAGTGSTATSGAMQTQPQTGVDIKTLLMIMLMVGGGLLLVIWAKQDQTRGKVHGRRK